MPSGRPCVSHHQQKNKIQSANLPGLRRWRELHEKTSRYPQYPRERSSVPGGVWMAPDESSFLSFPPPCRDSAGGDSASVSRESGIRRDAPSNARSRHLARIYDGARGGHASCNV
ncbi:hypothetical protein AVEN_84793-1 [Araneus ventricosus]|uniref:Uncharacterized protein n=1 Tax=Araneus ventricosus TaxID=182803 RepID=A0A4Y2S767_ARAVE|nr:hypothetical protein AVEN_84793-1 [Araneus ventricosus]